MVLKKADIYLVSDMEPDFVRRIFLQPFAQVQTAYDAAIEELGSDATVIAMPYGGSTLPKLVVP
jgi:nickel-dependent lactate racemase